MMRYIIVLLVPLTLSFSGCNRFLTFLGFGVAVNTIAVTSTKNKNNEIQLLHDRHNLQLEKINQIKDPITRKIKLDELTLEDQKIYDEINQRYQNQYNLPIWAALTFCALLSDNHGYYHNNGYHFNATHYHHFH